MRTQIKSSYFREVGSMTGNFGGHGIRAYQPSLDGLRGIAIILVLLFHAGAPFASGGYVGVDLFFVLSGYLITSQLLREHELHAGIHVGNFYWHRLMRLAPPLLLMLAVFVTLDPSPVPGRADEARDAFWAATYLSDYAVSFWGTPDLLKHTWSLSVEEHFYLLWPCVLILVLRRWKGAEVASVLFAGYLIATAWRWFCLVQGQTWQEVYYRFDTRLSGLLLGAFLSALPRSALLHERVNRYLPVLMWVAVAAAVLCLRALWGDPWMLTWGVTCAELAAVTLIIAAQDDQGQVARMLSLRPLVVLGRLSYGVYLWHYPVIRWMRPNHRWDDIVLVALPACIVLSALSYFSVEAWARAYRARLRQREQLPPSTSGPSPVRSSF
jgi:peptidoglycan/LPS O-acetylase OafA/YrhL